MMTLFDAPDRESSCVRRSRTNTSLQSLALLNETQRIEMSRKLAARLIRNESEDESRISLVFKMLACREPNPAELAASKKLLGSLRERYGADKEAAASLLRQGDASPDSLEPAEHAAWTQLAITLLASDVALVLY